MERGLVGAGSQLDAARLPATARVHLRLDDDPATVFLGQRANRGGVISDLPGVDGHPGGAEQLLGLVFVKVHGRRCG